MTEEITRGGGNVMDDIGMKPAQIILRMIETVDKNDTATLDEIDARVSCYWHRNRNFIEVSNQKAPFDKQVGYRYIKSETGKPVFGFANYLTRSRDALKAIRPEGWAFYISQTQPGLIWSAVFWKVIEGHDIEFKTPLLPTEELAELHAIIQAIEYERSGS